MVCRPTSVYLSLVTQTVTHVCVAVHEYASVANYKCALTVVTQVIRKMLILSRNQCRYIYLCHNGEDCYLKYRLRIHLLNIMVLKVEKSEKYC